MSATFILLNAPRCVNQKIKLLKICLAGSQGSRLSVKWQKFRRIRLETDLSHLGVEDLLVAELEDVFHARLVA